MQHITPRQLADRLAAGAQTAQPLLLDVREPWEQALCQLAGSTLIPMNQVPSRLSALDAGSDVVVICHHGVRSMQVAMLLEHHGFGSVYNLTGGVDAWAHEVDPAMTQY